MITIKIKIALFPLCVLCVLCGDLFQAIPRPILKKRLFCHEDSDMGISALFVFTDGLEELEAVAPLDILRRCGVDCTVASQTGRLEVTGRNGITLKTDCHFEEVAHKAFDLVVLPGGPGVQALRNTPTLLQVLQNQATCGKPVAAICAAPTVLHDAGLLENKSYTAHFTVADELPEIIEDSAVVVDGNIITSRGAGTSVEFGLTLAKILTDEDTAKEVAASIHYRARH